MKLFRSLCVAPVTTMIVTVAILSGCSALLMTHQDSSPEIFTMQYWDTPLLGSQYPEMEDPDIKKRKSFGVAFLGGGNRSAPATLGELRKLHELKWIDEARYITAVSGGAWAAIPYTFLKKDCASDDARTCQKIFLGNSFLPAEVAERVAEIKTYGKDQDPEFAKGSLLGALANSDIAANVVKGWTEGRFDETYAGAIEKIYLEPFGLGSGNGGKSDSVFTWREKDRDAIFERAPRFRNTEVHYVERDRPYLIVGGTVLTKRHFIKPKDKFRLEMTPLYTGVPTQVPSPPDVPKGFELGGGFVESAGYDYVTESVHEIIEVHEGRKIKRKMLDLRDPQFGNRTDSSRLNFSLGNMAGVAGAAPVEDGVSVPFFGVFLGDLGFPEHYIPVNQPIPGRHPLFTPKGVFPEKEWAHGDGGHEDNLGLGPLLARQVKNIISFVNAYAPAIQKHADECREKLEGKDIATLTDAKLRKRLKVCEEIIGTDIPSFFFPTSQQIHNTGLRLAENSMLATKLKDGSNVPERLRPYWDQLQVADEITKNHNNLSCNKYLYKPDGLSSPGGVEYEPTICFVWLGFDPDWFNQVCKTVDEKMSAQDRNVVQTALEFNQYCHTTYSSKLKFSAIHSNGFPHLGTSFDRRSRVLKADPARLFALSNYTSWQLQKHSGKIRDAFKRNGLNLP